MIMTKYSDKEKEKLKTNADGYMMSKQVYKNLFGKYGFRKQYKHNFTLNKKK